ncbi:hypothetical protein I4674_02465 [Proteus mirabilis]|nr:hypothetical protein [Proteus mirabilis]
MISKTSLFEPQVSFSNKKNYLLKKEDYVFTKKIAEIKNTPVSPSFGKRIIHVLTFLFRKLEIGFLIKDIKNNKQFGVVDINKHSNIFNEIDNKINKIKEEIKVEINESKNLYNSFDSFHEYIDCFTENEIDKKNIEIEGLIKEKGEIKNKNLNIINNIISHANDKFDFYSFCDYLTEVKRAKDFFSALDDIENEGSDSKLIVEYLNEIIEFRISSIDDKYF